MALTPAPTHHQRAGKRVLEQDSDANCPNTKAWKSGTVGTEGPPSAQQIAGAQPGSEELLWAEGKTHGQGKAAGRQCRRGGHVPGVGQGTLLKNEK